MDIRAILALAPHGPDTFVGTGPQYPWGGLYGGQIVAQSLRAAGLTVEDGFAVHSLRAYFIRRGDQDEPVRYEVERLRNGRSFCTRRVVARQATGAILNLEASFQTPEGVVDVQPVGPPPGVPGPEGLEESAWSTAFVRAFVPDDAVGGRRDGGGRAAAWLRVTDDFGDDAALHAAAFAYLSDDIPTDAVVRVHPLWALPEDERWKVQFSASLDHTIWFHRPMRADRWHLHDFTCHSFVGNRGLALGHVFDEAGMHVATIAQEVLLRDARERARPPSGSPG
jgi:acyl-CoA thioesterase-2